MCTDIYTVVSVYPSTHIFQTNPAKNCHHLVSCIYVRNISCSLLSLTEPTETHDVLNKFVFDLLFQSSLFSRTAMRVEVDEPAEEALRENKEHRDLQKRLQDIEEQLNGVTSSHSEHVSNGY